MLTLESQPLQRGIAITSTVSGSLLYYCDIIIHNSNIDSIEMECSCPLGSHCKHIVATLLHYLEHQQSTPQLPSPKSNDVIENWIKSLKHIDTHEQVCHNTPQNMQDEYFLTYRLFSTTGYQNDDLLFYKSKYLKNGTLSQGSKLDSYRVVDDHYFQELKFEADYDILSTIYKLYYRQHYNIVQFQKSQFWHDVILKIIATNRCYYNTNKEPLRLIDGVFMPTIKLHKYNDLYSLKSNVIKSRHQLIAALPALIIDTQANTIQEFGIDIELYNRLMQAPKMQLNHIAPIYSTIGKIAPQLELKTPKEIEKKSIQTSPIMHLTLLYEVQESFKEYHKMRLEFNYGDHLVDYYPQKPIQNLFEGDTLLEIIRDTASEKDAKAQLDTMGFSSLQEGNELQLFASSHSKQGKLDIWKEFLTTHIPTLEALGWIVHFDESFGMKFESNAQVVVESEEENNWFALDFNLEFSGTSQPIAPLIGSIIQEFDDLDHLPNMLNIEIDNHHYVEVESKQIAPIIKTILELFNKESGDGVFEINPFDAHLIEHLDESVVWKGNQELRELSRKLKDFKGIESVEPPLSLHATLRDYQQKGLNWLNFLHTFNFGGILTDDMGLGKTIQTLAHLARLKEQNKLTKPSLIVMPTSLIANWKNEVNKFTPNLSVLSLHGTKRMGKFKEIENHDLILTTYALIPRDEKKLEEHSFEYIILDEAQKIKNPKAKMTIAIKKLKSHYKLALSGTLLKVDEAKKLKESAKLTLFLDLTQSRGCRA